MARQHYIRSARQVPAMKTEPETPAMQISTHDHFGPCVVAADIGHHPGSSPPIYDIVHLTRLSWLVVRMTSSDWKRCSGVELRP